MPYMDAPVMPSVLSYSLGITNNNIHFQESPGVLTGHALRRKEGKLADNGALVVHTGTFTGRSPQDKFIVRDDISESSVYWNNFNIPIDERYFLQLKEKITAHLNRQPEIWVRDAQACAHPDYKLNIRVINEDPWSNLFVYNMFLRPNRETLNDFEPEWLVLHAPSFLANPVEDGTRQSNFAIISFAHKTILIGGTGYTGEIKKGVFSVLNFLLPKYHHVLPMHCSATVGKQGDAAVYFGLSGTGKTTLSADPERLLVGDDEHGWSQDSIFNFEGGCYAKVIDLSPEKEPVIYAAIRTGALVENTICKPETNEIDYACKDITENTRVSYPLSFIPNAVQPSVSCTPQNIFFLSADAYGVLPPVSLLIVEQAMYYFLSGYTARVAGTEAGVAEPKATFSACFGAPFLPLHPKEYATMLGEKLMEKNIKVWLINTGWTGGAYGVGKRIELKHTRAIIKAALAGNLDAVDYETHTILQLQIPTNCPGVPSEILNPKNTWQDKAAYDVAAQKLADEFALNFEKFKK